MNLSRSFFSPSKISELSCPDLSMVFQQYSGDTIPVLSRLRASCPALTCAEHDRSSFRPLPQRSCDEEVFAFFRHEGSMAPLRSCLFIIQNWHAWSRTNLTEGDKIDLTPRPQNEKAEPKGRLRFMRLILIDATGLSLLPASDQFYVNSLVPCPIMLLSLGPSNQP